MKKIKFLALILAVLFMCVVLPSCAEVVTVKDVTFAAITLDPDGNKDLLVYTLKGDITGTSDDPPTAFDAVIQILEENGVRHKVEDNAITSISGQAERTKGGYFYVWEYKINGDDPKGRATEILVQEGDHICYYLTPAKDNTEVETGDEDAEAIEDAEAAE